MEADSGKNRILGAVVFGLCRLIGFRKRKIDRTDLKATDFSTNTAKMGVRFNDRVRNVFRHKWLRKSQKPVSRKN